MKALDSISSTHTKKEMETEVLLGRKLDLYRNLPREITAVRSRMCSLLYKRRKGGRRPGKQ